MGIASVVRRGNGWLLPVALAIADWSWLWLLMAIVQTWIGEPSDGSPLVGWWICALILIGRGATVATRRMRSHRIRAIVVVAAGLALVLLASRLVAFPGLPLLDAAWLIDVAMRPMLVWSSPGTVDLVIGVGLLAWFRGARMGESVSPIDDVQSTFVVGLICLGAALALVAVVPASAALASVGETVVVLFLGSGLLSVALARVDEINREQRRNQDFELGLGPHWAATLATVLFVLVVVASALSGVLTFDRIDAVLRPIGAALDFILEVVILVVAVPVGYALEALIWLARMLLGKPGKPPQPPSFGNLAPRANGSQQLTGLSPQLTTVVHALAGATVVIAIGLLIYRSLIRWSDLDHVEGVPELRDFVIGWADLRTAALRWLGRLFRSRRGGESSASAPPDEIDAAPHPAPLTVREVYRDFLRFCRRAGVPRQIGQTPAEYARHPAFEGSGLGEPIDRLTHLYVRVRYGEELSDEGMVTESRRAADEIRLGILEQTHVGENFEKNRPATDRQES